jgi:hypothetical protein
MTAAIPLYVYRGDRQTVAWDDAVAQVVANADAPGLRGSRPRVSRGTHRSATRRGRAGDKSKELTEQDGLNRGFRYSAIRQKPQIVGLNGEIVAVCTIEWRCAQLNRHR